MVPFLGPRSRFGSDKLILKDHEEIYQHKPSDLIDSFNLGLILLLKNCVWLIFPYSYPKLTADDEGPLSASEGPLSAGGPLSASETPLSTIERLQSSCRRKVKDPSLLPDIVK